jgi:hypothetical protein
VLSPGLRILYKVTFRCSTVCTFHRNADLSHYTIFNLYSLLLIGIIVFSGSIQGLRVFIAVNIETVVLSVVTPHNFDSENHAASGMKLGGLGMVSSCVGGNEFWVP